MRAAQPNRSPIVRACLLGAALLAIPAGVRAQGAPANQPVTVTNAWARATPGGAPVGAAYLTLTDNGQPDRLTGASSPAAAKVALHESRTENGVMQMREVTGLPLEPGKPVTFAPGGYHMMLMGLRHPLKQGETFPLTLTFERAGSVTVQVNVAGPGASAPGGAGMPGMHGGHGG